MVTEADSKSVQRRCCIHQLFSLNLSRRKEFTQVHHKTHWLDILSLLLLPWSLQVHRYLNTYAEHASLGSELKASNTLYEQVTAELLAVHSTQHIAAGGGSDTQQLLQLSRLLLAYLEQAAQVARDKFCGMDLTAMVLGCVLMIGALAIHLGVAAR